MMKPTRIVLLDMHAILHRAYHALPDFESPSGEPTGALYGLTTFLLAIQQELKPDRVIACYDLPEPTHRHEVYTDYKAGRAETEDALIRQIDTSKRLLDAFSIPHYELAGYEADDLLATFTEQLKQSDTNEIIIASGDMDTLQLVEGKKVRVYTLKKGIKDTIIYDEDAVIKRYGFQPSSLPDYKGLRGDPSDNIPGIKGVGEKTATALLSVAPTLEELYNLLEKDSENIITNFINAGVTKRIVQLLLTSKDEAFFSKMLATVRRDAPMVLSLPDTSWIDSISLDRIVSHLRDYGFRSLIPRVESMVTKNVQKPTMFNSVERSVETDKKHIHSTERNNQNSSTGLFHTDPIFGEDDAETVSHELFHELAVMAWLIRSDSTDPSLKDIVSIAQGESQKNNEAQPKTYEDVETILEKSIKAQGLEKVFDEIEKPLITVIQTLNDRGVAFNAELLKNLSKQYSEELKIIINEITELAGVEFNISSPKQIREVLFEKMNLGGSKGKKTSTGLRSTAEKELVKMRDAHPIIDKILEYREISKLVSTYLDALPKSLSDDGRLRTRYVQTGTTTGRLSSESPNLQNIPIRSERGAPIRNAFIASKENTLIALDYSQIELRIAAMLSGDEKLLNTFLNNEDIHARVASEMFSVAPENVTKSQRSTAKTINFGILYGMGVNAVKENLGKDTTREDAGFFLDRYKESFPQLMDYLEHTKRFARKNGYTLTYFGRRRYFPLINSKLPGLRAQAERMSVNAPIQGTQADIIKKAMVDIDRWLEIEGFNSRTTGIVMQIHDEVVLEVPKSDADRIAKKVKSLMESVINPSDIKGLVLRADARKGDSWGNMNPIEQ